MIELPLNPSPIAVEAQLIDYGYVLRSSTGAGSLRVNRAGSRYRISVTYEPMEPDTARKFIARLQKAKRQGLRIDYPLLGQNQGSPGSPTVDGSGQSGTSLNIQNLTPGYVIREGYWLTIIDSSDNRYLHCASDTVVAAIDGTATITIEPPLRESFLDGDSILLAKPTIDGILANEVGWTLSTDQLIRGAQIVIEEAA